MKSCNYVRCYRVYALGGNRVYAIGGNRVYAIGGNRVYAIGGKICMFELLLLYCNNKIILQ